MINYTKKITTDREVNPIDNLDYSIESDRGRILSAPAFRRLQKRTQVFALELNASIRTRLTHSLEVAQVARFIAKSILTKLKREGLNTYGLEELENAFVSTAEMTSLLHDIGNPPFGHFAEQTINKWMKENALPILNTLAATLPDVQTIKEILAEDICNYDGNAQAIRVISKLQRLNLSYTQTLAVLKYTRGAYEKKPPKDDPLSYLKKKRAFITVNTHLSKSYKKRLASHQGTVSPSPISWRQLMTSPISPPISKMRSKKGF
jgi:dGTPase